MSARRNQTDVTPAAGVGRDAGAIPSARICHDIRTLLREAGLRPTRQRMSLGTILFAKGNRHVTAEMLHREAIEAKAVVSLATVYNALHQFTQAGLLRRVAVDGPIAYFDTNSLPHHHFLVGGENLLSDIPDADVMLSEMPIPPEGYEIDRIDVLVRLVAAPGRGGG